MKWFHVAWTGLLVCSLWAVTTMFTDNRVHQNTVGDSLLIPLHLPSPLRVTFVGTSLTASYNWPKLLELCQAHEIHISKIALNGATSEWGKNQIETIVATQPDIVFIEFSINDADLRRRVSLSRSRRNHQDIILGLTTQKPDIRIVLMTMNPSFGFRDLIRPRLSAYYEAYSQIAERLEVGLLDIYSRWLLFAVDQPLQISGAHPTEKDAEKIILPAIQSYLGLQCGWK